MYITFEINIGLDSVKKVDFFHVNTAISSTNFDRRMATISFPIWCEQDGGQYHSAPVRNVSFLPPQNSFYNFFCCSECMHKIQIGWEFTTWQLFELSVDAGEGC